MHLEPGASVAAAAAEARAAVLDLEAALQSLAPLRLPASLSHDVSCLNGPGGAFNFIDPYSRVFCAPLTCTNTCPPGPFTALPEPPGRHTWAALSQRTEQPADLWRSFLASYPAVFETSPTHLLRVSQPAAAEALAAATAAAAAAALRAARQADYTMVGELMLLARCKAVAVAAATASLAASGFAPPALPAVRKPPPPPPDCVLAGGTGGGHGTSRSALAMAIDTSRGPGELATWLRMLPAADRTLHTLIQRLSVPAAEGPPCGSPHDTWARLLARHPSVFHPLPSGGVRADTPVALLEPGAAAAAGAALKHVAADELEKALPLLSALRLLAPIDDLSTLTSLDAAPYLPWHSLMRVASSAQGAWSLNKEETHAEMWRALFAAHPMLFTTSSSRLHAVDEAAARAAAVAARRDADALLAATRAADAADADAVAAAIAFAAERAAARAAARAGDEQPSDDAADAPPSPHPAASAPDAADGTAPILPACDANALLPPGVDAETARVVAIATSTRLAAFGSHPGHVVAYIRGMAAVGGPSYATPLALLSSAVALPTFRADTPSVERTDAWRALLRSHARLFALVAAPGGAEAVALVEPAAADAEADAVDAMHAAAAAAEAGGEPTLNDSSDSDSDDEQADEEATSSEGGGSSSDDDDSDASSESRSSSEGGSSETATSEEERDGGGGVPKRARALSPPPSAEGIPEPKRRRVVETALPQESRRAAGDGARPDER